METIGQTWILEGRASLLPLAVSTEFGGYLDTLPWVASALEWDCLQPFTTINISEASAEELLVWVKSTALGSHTHMALCFSPEEPCLLVTLEEGIRHIDELFWTSPGVHFCFGVDLRDGKPYSHFEALLQYGAGDLLFAKLRPS